MTTKKKICIILATLFSLSIFAGCVGKKDSAQKETISKNSFEMDFAKYITNYGRLKINSSEYVTIGEYENIKVAKSKITPNDEEIESKINTILKSYSTKEIIKDGQVKSDSTVNIDYVGTVDGKEFQGGSTKGKGSTVTIGVTPFIDNFLNQLVGHSVGESFELKVTFPNEYPQNSSLAGKKAIFKVTINHLLGQDKIPEYTDEFVKNNKEKLGAETMSEHKNNITKAFEDEKKSKYILESLLTSSKVSKVPQEMIDYQADLFLFKASKQANQMGMTLENILKLMGDLTLDTFKTKMSDKFQKNAEQILILDSIVGSKKLDISDTDLKEKFGEKLEVYKSEFGEGYLKMYVAHEKIFSNAIETAKIQ